MERTAATVARLLPAVSHPRLQRGIVGVVRSAALAQRRLGALAERQAPAAGAWDDAHASTIVTLQPLATIRSTAGAGSRT
jgi:hypothetical protein